MRYMFLMVEYPFDTQALFLATHLLLKNMKLKSVFNLIHVLSRLALIMGDHGYWLVIDYGD